MNRTERAYAGHLAILQRLGRVRTFAFEALKLRLADATFYTPDFLVIAGDGVVELHEVKGYWEDDARVKIKVAAAQFPFFRFRAVKKTKQGWEEEHFGPQDVPAEPSA